MTEGNLELVDALVYHAITLSAVASIIVRHERRLRGEALARAWPPVVRDASIFALWNVGMHPICLLIHFARTRGWVGAAIGMGWMVAVVGAGLGAMIGVRALLEWLGV